MVSLCTCIVRCCCCFAIHTSSLTLSFPVDLCIFPSLRASWCKGLFQSRALISNTDPPSFTLGDLVDADRQMRTCEKRTSLRITQSYCHAVGVCAGACGYSDAFWCSEAVFAKRDYYKTGTNETLKDDRHELYSHIQPLYFLGCRKIGPFKLRDETVRMCTFTFQFPVLSRWGFVG